MDPNRVEGINGFNRLAVYGDGFDSHRPLHKSAKFTLIRLPLLAGHPPICAFSTQVLRPFCVQVNGSRYR